MHAAPAEIQPEIVETTVQLFPEETGGEIMTIGEKLRKEGRIEGRHDRDREIALQMLEKGFDLETMSELTNMTPEQLDRLQRKAS